MYVEPDRRFIPFSLPFRNPLGGSSSTTCQTPSDRSSPRYTSAYTSPCQRVSTVSCRRIRKRRRDQKYTYLTVSFFGFSGFGGSCDFCAVLSMLAANVASTSGGTTLASRVEGSLLHGLMQIYSQSQSQLTIGHTLRPRLLPLLRTEWGHHESPLG